MEKKKISLSIFDLQRTIGWEKAFETVKDAGFDGIDFNIEYYNLSDNVYSASEDEFVSYFTKIKQKADSLGLEIFQTHGRSYGYDPVNEDYNEQMKLTVEKDMYASEILGAPACVIHQITCTRWGKKPAEVLREECRKMYADFIPSAEKHKVKISLETFGAAKLMGEKICSLFSYPSELKYQLDAMDTEYKTICLDTGHTHEVESFWVPPVEEMIRILGKDITITHLHDNMGVRDDHLIPSMGNINWPKVFDAFEETGYNGAYNFELRLAFWGSMQEEAVKFIGKYLRRFVDEKGRI